jgi:hypothetical protein
MLANVEPTDTNRPEDGDRVIIGGFEIAGGSVAGQAHAAAGRNNQDAFAWEATPCAVAAVVCDGCGSAPRSEVGAAIGARLLVRSLARLAAMQYGPEELLERARLELLGRLRELALAMSGPDASRFARTVLDHLLFTIVGAVLTPGWATTFSIGDGLVFWNGDRRQLGPFPGNEPPYLAYALLSNGDGERRFEIHRPVPVDEARSLLLATDGAVDLERMADRAVPGRDEPVGSIAQFWTEDRFFQNPDMVRRRLTIVGRGARGGLVPDDTTLVVLRRAREEA